MKKQTDLPLTREELEREVDTFTKPVDLDAFISKGLIAKRGAWYYVPNMHKLPNHVRQKISEVKTAPDGKPLVKFYSSASIARAATKAAKAGFLDPAKARAAQQAATVIGVQKDWETEKWYFIVWADEARKRVKFQSDPVFAQEDDANAAAADWVRRAARPSNFSWGTRHRPPTKR